MGNSAVSFEWILNEEAKVRDGQYGPIFTGLRTDNGELLWAERLELEAVLLEKALSNLRQVSQDEERADQTTLKFFGYQQKEGHVYLLTEAMHSGTLRDLIQRYEGPVPLSIIRRILRALVRGLERLHTDQGFGIVFLDGNSIWMTGSGTAIIEPPPIDVTIAGQPFRAPLLSLPEIVLGKGNIRKADVWLLGIVTAQLLSGDVKLGADYSSAISIGSQINQNQESALELLLSDRVPDDPLVVDFVRQCLTVDSNKRPGVGQLRDHPLLHGEE